MKKKKAIWIAISIAVVVVVAALAVMGVFAFSKKSDPAFVAHRGYSESYVGNTEDAFLAASERGFYGIETDIWKTKDGFYVCNHDETVKYQSGEEKEVSATDLEELLAIPLKNDKTATSVYLCTFERYLEICKKGGKTAVIELKEDFSSDELREIFAIVDRAYDRKCVSVISFFFDPLLVVKREYPGVDVQYLSETKNDPIFEKCLKEGVSLDVRQSILTGKMVRAFHDAGLTVNTWTVDKKIDLLIVRLKGVDYVTTDLFCKE